MEEMKSHYDADQSIPVRMMHDVHDESTASPSQTCSGHFKSHFWTIKQHSI